MGARQHIREGDFVAKRTRLWSSLLGSAVIAGSISVVACVVRPAAITSGVQTEKSAKSHDDAIHNDVVSDTGNKADPQAYGLPAEEVPTRSDISLWPRDKQLDHHASTGWFGQPKAVANLTGGTLFEDSYAATNVAAYAAPIVVSSNAVSDSTSAKSVTKPVFGWRLWWFLAGLLVGLLPTALLLLRRRMGGERETSASALMEIDAQQVLSTSTESIEVSTLAVEQVASQPAPMLSVISAEPIASWVERANTEPPLSVASIAQRALMPSSGVETSFALPSTPATHIFSPARDLRRARLLLKQDEEEQALAMIEPHLRNLQRERSTAECEANVFYLDTKHPIARAVATIHADVRWQLAHKNRRSTDYVQAMRALETYLIFRPEDTVARLRMGRCLMDQASVERDELLQASLLQSCIDILLELVNAVAMPHQVLLGALGEALCRRALLNPAIDEIALAEAEAVLRQALAMGAADNSDATWWLQQSLRAVSSTMDSTYLVARQQESIAWLRRGLAASDAVERGRWQAALLRAELDDILRMHLGVAARRLRLRDLHTRYADAMLAEQSPDVLSAWVELLCALTEPLVGNAALGRYREIDNVLAQLSANDAYGCLHAAAWVKMMHGRLRVESNAAKRELLVHGETILGRCMDVADAALHLEASKLALARAAWAQTPTEQDEAYARALALARPLTAVPSLAIPALRIVLNVLLVTGEDKERRVFATCLRVINPDDVESLSLLAKSACRDAMPVDACRYLDQAMHKHGAALSEEMIGLWRNALERWAEQSGRDDSWSRNQRSLRVAAGRRRA